MRDMRLVPKLFLLFSLVEFSTSYYNYSFNYNKYKVKSHTKPYTSYAYTPAPPPNPPFRQRYGISKPPEGPNINPYQCKSRTTGQVGVCMFVWECSQANGTHVDVCQDGFYIGSCCQLSQKVVTEQIQTNEIGFFPSLQHISTKPTTTTTTTSTTTVKPTTKRTYPTHPPKRTTLRTTTSTTTDRPTTEKYTSEVVLSTAAPTTRPLPAQNYTFPSYGTLPIFASIFNNTVQSTTESTIISTPTTTKLTESATFSVSTPRPLSIFASLTSSTESPIIAPNALQDTDFFSENGTLLINNFRQICGRQFLPTSRIVGGIKATNGEWPWQISVRVWSPMDKTFMHACGGVLLNEMWAATAAHCLEKATLDEVILRMGEYDLSEDIGPYSFIERRVQLIIPHPKFSGMRRSFEYDLALVRFYEPVVFQPNIVPICVPDSDDSFEGQFGYVTGWGRLREKGPIPAQLHEVQLPIISNSKCETMFRAAGLYEFIPKIFMCAAWPEGDKDACDGDSGSGLSILREEDKRWILGGIVSWGHGCGLKNQPGVYTRITEFRNWINLILSF